MIPGTITETNRTADRVAVHLSNGRFAVCRLLDRRGRLPVGEAVHGQLSRPGASMLTAKSSNQKFRALVLAVYPSRASALEMVHG